MSGYTNDPYQDYITINKELENFDKSLMKKPQIIIANKMDMPNSKANLQKFKEKVNKDVYEMSAINGDGINKIILKLADMLDAIPKSKLYNDEKFESHVIYKFKEEKPYKITKENDAWVISGKPIEKLLIMSRLDTDEAILRFSNKLRKMGIDDELRELGAKDGDTIKIMDYEFEFKE